MNTLTDILNNSNPGDYIKGLTGIVKFPETKTTKTGKTFWKAKLEDGGTKAYLTSFSQNLDRFANQHVEFSGMGIKRGDDFNGTAQFTINEKTRIKAASAAQEAPEQENTEQDTPSPQKARKTQGNGHSGPSVAAGGASAQELAKIWARLALLTREAFNEAGLPEVADNAALRAPEWGALWWFGERGIKFDSKQPASPPQEPPDDDEPPF